MTSEAKKIYMKKWREENKAKIAERDKKYRKDNKEKIAEKNKKYYQENTVKITEYNKKYNQAEEGKKSKRISRWKQSGVISEDFDALYDYYLIVDKCEECNIELVEVGAGANKKCLNHDHTTGLFRDILCNGCNIKRG